MPITIENGTLRIERLSASNYAGGQTSFETFSSDGTRVLFGWDVISHIVMLVVHENRIKSIEKLKDFTSRGAPGGTR